MKFVFEGRDIKALCPELRRDIEVLDDWCPSYMKRGKRYVDASVNAADATKMRFFSEHYSSAFIGYDGKAYRYAVSMSVWGADDTGLEKLYYTNDLTEAVGHYRQFKKMMNKLKRSHAKDLKYYLYDLGFGMA